jgi:hypothetical protein
MAASSVRPSNCHGVVNGRPVTRWNAVAYARWVTTPTSIRVWSISHNTNFGAAD